LYYSVVFDVQGGFSGKQRHDDAAEKPNRVFLKRRLQTVQQSLLIAFVLQQAVERLNELCASAERAFRSACGVA
jgi:hypothetical protein